MAVNLPKRFVARHLWLRLITFSFFVFGIFAVWFYKPSVEQTPARFLIHLPTKIEPKTILENRNLSDYESGGTFTNCSWVSENEFRECVNAQDKGRDFILQHWKAKKRGYIVYDVTGGDGGADFHIFIEPDENSNWHVITRWKQFFPYNGMYDYCQIEETDALFIERKPNKNNSDSQRTGKFYLSFLDQNGNEVDTL